MISATNADLDALVESDSFRKDLLYRLNTITIHIPALRERAGDILPLAEQFIAHNAHKYRLEPKALATDAVHILQAYHWPGNVRELGHVIERAMFLSTGDHITAKDLALEHAASSSINSANSSEIEQPEWMTSPLEDIEKQIIEARLDAFDNNPQKTAESLGLSRSAYYRRLEKYNLN